MGVGHHTVKAKPRQAMLSPSDDVGLSYLHWRVREVRRCASCPSQGWCPSCPHPSGCPVEEGRPQPAAGPAGSTRETGSAADQGTFAGQCFQACATCSQWVLDSSPCSRTSCTAQGSPHELHRQPCWTASELSCLPLERLLHMHVAKGRCLMLS
jgi:hypothetical protein